jgi:hypothetical protein
MLQDEPTPTLAPRRLSRAVATVLFLALALTGTRPQALGSETTRADSRVVKAVFLVNFLSFANWPSGKLAPAPARLVIAVLGDPSFVPLVEKAAAGRSVNGRPIVVQAIDTAEAGAEAHLVFIATSQSQRLPAVLRSLANTAVLTVGDTDGFAQDGVAINLYTFDNRVRIEVNNTAAARAGVHLSANLLRLARIVE